MHTAEEMEAKIRQDQTLVLPSSTMSTNLSGGLGAIGLSSTSRYLARGREVQHTQFARPMVTKVVVATNVATSWDCSTSAFLWTVSDLNPASTVET